MDVRANHSEPNADPIAAGREVIESAREAEVPLRLLGGVAVRVHGHRELPAGMQRAIPDIDLAGGRGDRTAIRELLLDSGYVENEQFNALNGSHRLVFYDVPHNRHVDVFLGEFRMCHHLDLESRLEVDSMTIPLAELLLSKLQVVEVNRKDVVDVAAILLDHEVGEGDVETVNAAQVAEILAADWGWWRTVTQTIGTAREHLGSLGLTSADQELIDQRMTALMEAVEAEPKSRKWKMRARVGERMRWYDEPEEIGHSEEAAAGAL